MKAIIAESVANILNENMDNDIQDAKIAFEGEKRQRQSCLDEFNSLALDISYILNGFENKLNDKESYSYLYRKLVSTVEKMQTLCQVIKVSFDI